MMIACRRMVSKLRIEYATRNVVSYLIQKDSRWAAQVSESWKALNQQPVEADDCWI